MKKYIGIVLVFSLMAFVAGSILPASATESNDKDKENRVFNDIKKSTDTKTVDLVCMRKAVEKRENSIAAAFTTFSGGINTAFLSRKTALLSAWGMTTLKDRSKALFEAWKNFRTSKKAAAKTYNETRQTAWQTFRTERKACNSGPTGENPDSDVVSVNSL